MTEVSKEIKEKLDKVYNNPIKINIRDVRWKNEAPHLDLEEIRNNSHKGMHRTCKINSVHVINKVTEQEIQKFDSLPEAFIWVYTGELPEGIKEDDLYIYMNNEPYTWIKEEVE